MTDSLMKRKNLDLDTYTGRLSGEHEHRDQDNESASQGIPKTSGKHQKLEERHGMDSPSQDLKEPTLITP